MEKKLSFYTVSKDYIEYLRNKELEKRGFTKVSSPTGFLYKNEKCYLGILFEINGNKYITPLTHPKQHYEDNKIFFNRISTKITVNKNNRDIDFGRIMYCYMIPVVSDTLIEEIDINSIEDFYYRMLLITQYRFINETENYKKIIAQAQKIYKRICGNPQHYLAKICCDFKYLEQVAETYK